MRAQSTSGYLFSSFLALALTLACSASHAIPPGGAVRVLSSLPDQVTGGDARIEIALTGNSRNTAVTVTLNGDAQALELEEVDARTLSGVISGLVDGANTLAVNQWRLRGNRKPPKLLRSDTLALTNYPVSGPVFSGEHQKAFVCTAQDHGIGPLVPDYTNDPATDPGWPVYDAADNLVGRSTTCQVEPVVVYRYRSTNGDWKAYSPGDTPADLATTTTIDGDEVDYIVRWERGVINRFIYSMAVLDPEPAADYTPRGDAWNGRLLYYFQGGVGIGHTQGSPSTSRMLYHDALKLGYAVIYSTGTKTGTHYDLELGAETALMTKERFIEAYGAPLYTVGVGGSGGGIQQYVYGQNLGTRLIDAGVAQYAYPDMLTQTIHIGDCELLEYYMDVTSLFNTNSVWATWSNRTWLIGLNADDYLPNPFTLGVGIDECVRSWRGLSPLALNHLYGYESGIETINPAEDVLSVQWTHWEDAVNIYGRDENGFARSTWDNVGVQYGLQALVDGNIGATEFLRINRFVGGWKESPELVQESCPYFPSQGCFNGFSIPDQWDPWSVKNQNTGGGTSVAPRREGSIEAMRAAYEKGHVFVGDIDIPIIDWRHYLEHVLDMHNSHQSFASRQRMLDHDGDASNQVIWFTDARGIDEDDLFDQTPEALAVLDEWVLNIRAHPELSVDENKPALAVDRCFDSGGAQIDAGDGVWAGILDDAPAGTCTTAFPIYGTSRTVAGGRIGGRVFKCALQTVEQAIANGVYGSWAPGPAQIDALRETFPDGVCDYTQPDQGLPPP